ncbi:hypothetical protein [Aestuariimicrobium ganziense]|uniref:hypothetical protein n=1 Tax=Aestuariimicrobium ganziense TaxID=2773677 RepID=UPI001943CFD8|nr:hypothetical protein [Aestuariimicrobium ganziense]
MGKLVWFTVGVGVTVFVVVKGKELMRKATPAGVQEQVAARTESLQHRASEFLSTFTEAMKSREDELRAELNMDEEAVVQSAR